MKRAFTIYYDESSMEVEKVDIGDAFAADSVLARADVLKHCYEYFAETYNATLTEMEAEWGRYAK
jgi:hypothetical protein